MWFIWFDRLKVGGCLQCWKDQLPRSVAALRTETADCSLLSSRAAWWKNQLTLYTTQVLSACQSARPTAYPIPSRNTVALTLEWINFQLIAVIACSKWEKWTAWQHVLDLKETNWRSTLFLYFLALSPLLVEMHTIHYTFLMTMCGPEIMGLS